MLYVHKKKSFVFQCGIKNFFGLNTSTYKNKIVSFQCGIKKPFEVIF